MKITDSREKEIRYGNTESKALQVNTANSKFFRVMSDNLYSDKIGSIIRELASNAVDAHRSAGTLDTPFEVFLPCNKNPKFCIRDYGTGLSKEQIEQVYTVYFESDKDHNDDDIGGYGLGAKTPFSYTDGFVVRSYYNGTLYTYTISFNGDNPEYQLQFTQTTQEPNGLEVFFDVDPEDFTEFSTKAFKTLIWFNNVPNVWSGSEDENGFFKVNHDMINHRERIVNFRNDITAEDDNMVVVPIHFDNPFSFNSTRMPSPICVLQGGVLYPVSENVTQTIRSFSESFPGSHSVVIKCPIGEVALTPSREQIEENKKTLANIEKRISNIVEKGEGIVTDKLSNQDLSKFAHNNLIENYTSRSRRFPGDTADTLTSDIENAYIQLMAKRSPQTFYDMFEQRFNETIRDYQSRLFSLKNVNHSLSHEKFSAYVNEPRYQKPRKIKDIDDMRFSPSNFKRIHIVLRESGVMAPITEVLSQAGVDNHELAFVIDAYKQNIKSSQYSTKADYLDACKNVLVNHFECDESDLSIVWESDYITKVQATQRKQYAKNNYAIFCNDNTQNVYTQASLNTLEPLLEKEQILVYAKKQGHSECVIKNGDNDYTMSRQDLVSHCFKARLAFGYHYDKVIIVNDKELNALIKHSEATLIEAGHFLTHALTDTNGFEQFVDELLEMAEKEAYISTFDEYQKMIPIMQLIGKEKDVAKLNNLIDKFGSLEDNNAGSYEQFAKIREASEWFENIELERFVSLRGGTGMAFSLAYDIGYMIRHSQVFSEIGTQPEKAVMDSLRTVANAASSKHYLDIDADTFLNGETVADFPILKPVLHMGARSRFFSYEGYMEELVEYIQFKLAQKAQNEEQTELSTTPIDSPQKKEDKAIA